MTILTKLSSIMTRGFPRIEETEYGVMTPESLTPFNDDEFEIINLLENDQRFRDSFHLFLALSRRDSLLSLYDELNRYAKAETPRKRLMVPTIYDLFLKRDASFPVELDLDTNHIAAMESASRHGTVPEKTMQIIRATLIRKLVAINVEFQHSPRYRLYKNKHSL